MIELFKYDIVFMAMNEQTDILNACILNNAFEQMHVPKLNIPPTTSFGN